MVFSPSLKASPNSLFTAGGDGDDQGRGSRGPPRAAAAAEGEASPPRPMLAAGDAESGAVTTQQLATNDLGISSVDVGVEVDGAGASAGEEDGRAVANRGGGGALAAVSGGAPSSSSSPAAGDVISSPQDKDFVEEARVHHIFFVERRLP